MSSRAELVVTTIQPIQHGLLPLLRLSNMNSRNSIPCLALVVACVLFSSGVTHAVMQKTVVDNYEFTWVSHAAGQYDWDDVMSENEVNELPGLENSRAYPRSLPFDYAAFRTIPVSSYDLVYIERTSEPPNDAWALMSLGYSEDYIPTLDTWIDIIRSEDHLDIAPAVPIGLLIDVTALPEPTTLLLALLALVAAPLRVRCVQAA
jgi:hypothetical protein